MPDPTEMTEQDRRRFVQELPLVMHRAGQLGLFRTQHALHEAVKASGYELADMLKREKVDA